MSDSQECSRRSRGTNLALAGDTVLLGLLWLNACSAWRLAEPVMLNSNLSRHSQFVECKGVRYKLADDRFQTAFDG